MSLSARLHQQQLQFQPQGKQLQQQPSNSASSSAFRQPFQSSQTGQLKQQKINSKNGSTVVSPRGTQDSINILITSKISTGNSNNRNNSNKLIGYSNKMSPTYAQQKDSERRKISYRRAWRMGPIYMHLLHLRLYDKFSQSQNYYYTRDVNDLLCSSRTPFTIKHNDFVLLDESEEYMKRLYFLHEYPGKIKLLTEYYKFHSDIPRLFMLPLAPIISHMHDKKRRIEFYRIAKIIDEENKLNPDKPPKGIVGDVPAPDTDESLRDYSIKDEEKKELNSDLSNLLRDISSFVNYGKGNENESQSMMLVTGMTKHNKEKILQLNLNKYNVRETYYQKKQIEMSAVGSKRTSIRNQDTMIMNTLSELNLKLNEIVQSSFSCASSVMTQSEATIQDITTNHGLDQFLAFIAKDNNNVSSINKNKVINNNTINNAFSAINLNLNTKTEVSTATTVKPSSQQQLQQIQPLSLKLSKQSSDSSSSQVKETKVIIAGERELGSRTARAVAAALNMKGNVNNKDIENGDLVVAIGKGKDMKQYVKESNNNNIIKNPNNFQKNINTKTTKEFVIKSESSPVKQSQNAQQQEQFQLMQSSQTIQQHNIDSKSEQTSSSSQNLRQNKIHIPSIPLGNLKQQQQQSSSSTSSLSNLMFPTANSPIILTATSPIDVSPRNPMLNGMVSPQNQQQLQTQQQQQQNQFLKGQTKIQQQQSQQQQQVQVEQFESMSNNIISINDNYSQSQGSSQQINRSTSITKKSHKPKNPLEIQLKASQAAAAAAAAIGNKESSSSKNDTKRLSSSSQQGLGSMRRGQNQLDLKLNLNSLRMTASNNNSTSGISSLKNSFGGQQQQQPTHSTKNSSITNAVISAGSKRISTVSVDGQRNLLSHRPFSLQSQQTQTTTHATNNNIQYSVQDYPLTSRVSSNHNQQQDNNNNNGGMKLPSMNRHYTTKSGQILTLPPQIALSDSTVKQIPSNFPSYASTPAGNNNNQEIIFTKQQEIMMQMALSPKQALIQNQLPLPYKQPQMLSQVASQIQQQQLNQLQQDQQSQQQQYPNNQFKISKLKKASSSLGMNSLENALNSNSNNSPTARNNPSTDNYINANPLKNNFSNQFNQNQNNNFNSNQGQQGQLQQQLSSRQSKSKIQLTATSTPLVSVPNTLITQTLVGAQLTNTNSNINHNNKAIEQTPLSTKNNNNTDKVNNYSPSGLAFTTEEQLHQQKRIIDLIQSQQQQKIISNDNQCIKQSQQVKLTQDNNIQNINSNNVNNNVKNNNNNNNTNTIGKALSALLITKQDSAELALIKSSSQHQYQQQQWQQSSQPSSTHNTPKSSIHGGGSLTHRPHLHHPTHARQLSSPINSNINLNEQQQQQQQFKQSSKNNKSESSPSKSLDRYNHIYSPLNNENDLQVLNYNNNKNIQQYQQYNNNSNNNGGVSSKISEQQSQQQNIHSLFKSPKKQHLLQQQLLLQQKLQSEPTGVQISHKYTRSETYHTNSDQQYTQPSQLQKSTSPSFPQALQLPTSFNNLNNTDRSKQTLKNSQQQQQSSAQPSPHQSVSLKVFDQVTTSTKNTSNKSPSGLSHGRLSISKLQAAHSTYVYPSQISPPSSTTHAGQQQPSQLFKLKNISPRRQIGFQIKQ